ncbi:hypothetical protein ACN6MY_19155 [Peribacillus sp. B-H-3]|uniref:hypothetical protein n=1 Tax=Peribacillus sp. B-H-3 TaxID=3400420 RepID=UPI003B01770E
MKRWMSLLCLITAILAGCTNNHVKESRPPKAEIITDGKHYKTVPTVGKMKIRVYALIQYGPKAKGLLLFSLFLFNQVLTLN